MQTLIKPADLIRKYYFNNPQAHQILLQHSRKVTKRALHIARNLPDNNRVDLQFIAEAAMLHDIGMIMTNTPDLHCHGEGDYLCHGIRGRDILEEEGYPRHARVCERHIGVGLTAEEIKQQQLPLPARDMLPETLEEQIICYADLFYSKSFKNRDKEKAPAKILKSLKNYGEGKQEIFLNWLQHFEPELVQK